MAWDAPLGMVGPFTATANYTSAKKQFLLVKTTDGVTFRTVAVKGAQVNGVLLDNPSSGTAGQIGYVGFFKVRVTSTAHVAIVPGAKLMCSSVGGALPSTGGVANYIFGRAVSSLSSNSTGIITAQLTFEGAGSSGTVLNP